MVYFVQKENPQPDSYIAIFIRTSSKEFRDRDRHEMFKSKASAVAYAKKLALEFSVHTIRLFYEGGHSENLKKDKK